MLCLGTVILSMMCVTPHRHQASEMVGDFDVLAKSDGKVSLWNPEEGIAETHNVTRKHPDIVKEMKAH